jgi:hypothetical protein
MKQWQATTLALLIAPCVPALTLSRAGSLGFALALYPFCAQAVLALGVPAYLLGCWLNLVRWWSALIVGLIGGVIVLA